MGDAIQEGGEGRGWDDRGGRGEAGQVDWLIKIGSKSEVS